MTTICMDSRTRVAWTATFKVDLGESALAERRPAGRLQDPHGRQE